MLKSSAININKLILYFIIIFSFLSVNFTVFGKEWDKSEIQIAIISELIAMPYSDEVTIKLVDNTDEKLLTEIARRISIEFNAKIENAKLFTSNEDFPDDKSYQLVFNMPVVPRGKEYLPIAEFMRASAPYAKRVRIVYYVIGRLHYRGYYSDYKSNSVDFKVDMPLRPDDVRTIYGIDATLKKKNLDGLTIPIYEVSKKTKSLRIVIAIAIGIIIFTLGVIIAVIFSHKEEKKKKEKEANMDNSNSSNL